MTGPPTYFSTTDERTVARTEGPRDRHLPIAVGYGIPPDVSIAWLAVAPLYMLGPRGLPEPIVALLVSTTVGVFSAVVKAGLVYRIPRAPVGPSWRPAARRDPAVHPPTPVHPPAPVHQSVPVRPPVIGRPTPTPTPTPTPSAERSTADIDYDRYVDAHPAETQCPHCGGFTVNRRGGRVAIARCATCASEWDVGEGIAPPDVVVRSWLFGSAREPK